MGNKTSKKSSVTRKVSPRWDGQPTTVKLADWTAFKEANHLRSIRFYWPEGGQPVMVAKVEPNISNVTE